MTRHYAVLLALLVLAGMAFSIDVSSCQLINSPGTYDLIQSVSGAPYGYYCGNFGCAYDACIVINETSDVVFDCHGYSITASGGTNPTGIAVEDASEVVLRNCDINSTQDGISVVNVTGVNVTDNNITANWAITGILDNLGCRFERNDMVVDSYGIFTPADDSYYADNTVDGGSTAYYGNADSVFERNTAMNAEYCFEPFEGSELYENDAYNCSGACFYLGASDLTAEDNTADLCGYGYDLEGSSNNELVGNEASNSDIGIALRTYFGEGTIFTENNLLEENLVTDSGIGIWGNYARYNTLEDNEVQSSASHGVEFNHTIENTFRRNLVNDSGGDGYRFYNSTGEDIRYDDATENSGAGMHLIDSDFLDIVSVNTEDNGGHGVHLQQSGFNEILGGESNGNGDDGIRFGTSHYNRVDGYVCNDNADAGIYLWNSHFNDLFDGNLYFNTYGIVLSDTSHDNELVGNIARNNSVGFRLSNADDNELSGDTAEYNFDGFAVLSGSEGNELTGCEAANNTGYGYIVEDSPDTILTVNMASFNGNKGFYISNADKTVIDGNGAQGNGDEGFHIYDGSTDAVLTNNVAQWNTDGFVIEESAAATVTRNNAYNNSRYGMWLNEAPDTTVSRSLIFGNGDRGAYIYDSDGTTMTEDYLFGNGLDVVIESAFSWSFDLDLTDVIFDNPAGGLLNFTNLTMQDSVDLDGSYSMSWAPEPPGLSLQRSFAGKWLNISRLFGTMDIDSLAFRWTDDELTNSVNYTEEKFSLDKYNGTWRIINSSTDPVTNTLSYSGLTEGSSVIGIVESMVSDDDNGHGPADEEMSIGFESTCNRSVVTVADGMPVIGADVEVMDADTLSEIASGLTDGSGELSFQGCGVDVKILVSASGYQSTSLIRSLIACSLCELPECASDDDCPDAERCAANVCVPVPCDCGIVSAHACQGYACCADSDCGTDQECVDNECMDKETPGCSSDDDCLPAEFCDIPVGAASGSCEDVTGQCGYASDHIWIEYGYECGDEEGCPECEGDLVCVNHECVGNEIRGEDGFVGDTQEITATVGGEPCVDCPIQVTGPDNKTFTGMTDSEGKFRLPLTLEGDYRVVLVDEDGGTAAETSLKALAKPGIGDEEKPTQTGDDLASLAFLLVLLVIIVALLIYTRRK